MIYFWDIYLLLYLILIAAPLSIILHEFGHAFAASVVKADHISVSIGKGKRVHLFAFKKIQIIIHAIFFLGGLAESDRKIPYKSYEIVWISISGPIMSGIIAFLFYKVDEMYPSNYLQLFCWFNIWLAVVNIVPFKIKEKHTDGYTIINALRKNNNSIV